MSWYRRVRNVFRPEHLSDELETEFQYHLAETADRLMAGGMSEPDARREARRKLGTYSVQKERTRDMNVLAWLDSTRADVVYGLRQLRANPGFTAVAILSLALGIGANTAIFQLVNAIRLKTLPVHNPQELVSIDFQEDAVQPGMWFGGGSATYAQWRQIREQQQAFTDVPAWSPTRFNLAAGGEPRYANGLLVSGEFFPTLGVGAVLGRVLTGQDDSPTCSAAAVLTYAFWQNQFGGDPTVIGRTLTLDGHTVSIAGVTPPSFFGVQVGSRFDVALPLCADRIMGPLGLPAARADLPKAHWLAMMGRLKTGWTVEQASAHLRALSPGIMRATLPAQYTPDVAKGYLTNKLMATDGGSGVSDLRYLYERPLWLLMAATGLVLLIACANLANLLLARATVRQPEIAVRLAIGASRGRLVRQLLSESLLLALAGAGLGAAVALGLSRALIAFISPRDNPLFLDAAPDWRVLAFTAGLAVLTCLLFGLLPAWRATAGARVPSMRGATAGRERFRFRRALVAGQVALSLILLFGAFLFVRSLHNLLTVDTGFQAEGILRVNVNFDRAGYPRQRRLLVYRELQERLSSLPGVAFAAQVLFTPVGGGSWNSPVGLDGAAAAGSGKMAFFNQVGRGYFRTMGTRLIAGRDFDDRDTLSAPKAAIVNEMFARKFLGGSNPVGHSFRRETNSGQAEPLYQIVGLVANTKYGYLSEDFRPLAYFPVTQDEEPGPEAEFVLRMTGSPGQLMNRAKEAVAAMSPAMGIEFRPLSAQLRESLSRERLMATLSGAFGGLAALLAMLGIYGVIGYMVARRRNELGLRLALGAGRGDVIGLVLREALVLLGAGLAAGIVLALWAGRAAAALLYGLAPHDGASLLSAGGLLAAIALLASYVPARRAAALDPMSTLRNE